jgi:hypothetical protein
MLYNEIHYEVKNPNGVLIIKAPRYIKEEKVKYECDCAYSAWSDTDKEDDSFLDLPEYILGCLRDSGVNAIEIEFIEEIN